MVQCSISNGIHMMSRQSSWHMSFKSGRPWPDPDAWSQHLIPGGRVNRTTQSTAADQRLPINAWWINSDGCFRQVVSTRFGSRKQASP